MNTFFSIIGLTSSGKTQFAFSLARALLQKGTCSGVAICSADSRQVFKGLEILSGADIDSTLVKKSTTDFEYEFYENKEQTIFLFGQSIIEPDLEWSVSHFKVLADSVCAWCEVHNYALIFVGGTGLYHQQLQAEDTALFIPPNTKVREEAKLLTVNELQSWLQSLNEVSFSAMNNSDRHNPRRLVRAIEKTLWSKNVKQTPVYSSLLMYKTHIAIGLDKDIADVERAIEQRIEQRIHDGVLMEVESTVKKHGTDIPASTTLGFNEVAEHLNGAISLKECQDSWKVKEMQYVKRQQTWWKAHPPTQWLEINTTTMQTSSAELIDQYGE